MNRVIDARELPESATIETDVCIVGSGAAGLTLAAELAGTPLDVCVVESGGWEYEEETQNLYRGRNAGPSYFPLDANRQRSFGGTTNLWAGWCRPLDEIDFQARPWVADSGWPFSRDALLPYYERAHERCGLGPLDYDPAAWEARLAARRLGLAPDHFVTRILRRGRRSCFRDLYGTHVAPARNIRLVLHANVVELEEPRHGGAVSGLTCAWLAGRRFRVAARLYVLAGGAIENARLLLASRAVQPKGIGNANDLVGRYFMEHLHFQSALVDLERPHAFDGELYRPTRSDAVGRLFPSESVQAREAIASCSVMVEALYAGDESDASAVLARFVDALRRARGRNPLPRRAARLVGDALRPLPRLARPLRGVRLHHTLEQSPNRESRVLLDDERDALGMPRPRLEWRTSALEERTWRRSLELLDVAFREAGIGRMRALSMVRAWPPPPLQGMRGHHMGTTRMSTDPRRGVVDADCRVYGVANLFIAGSSVFPTSGAGTPTLTIAALAIRLADKIKELQGLRPKD